MKRICKNIPGSQKNAKGNKGETMGDTIFYRGKIKRTKTPAQVFEKIQKSIKKKGPTKNWICTVDEENEYLCIDFHDDASESFVLAFNGTEFDGSCKVAFPLEGELFEDGKSEFKALLDALYAAKSMYSKIEIFDDYGLAESYWDSKRFKCAFRELTSQEKERVRRLYDAGSTDYKQLLLAVVAEDMGIAVDELEKNINPLANAVDDYVIKSTQPKYFMQAKPPIIRAILETYIYETMEYQKRGRVCAIPYEEYTDELGKMHDSLCTFVLGIEELHGGQDKWGDCSFSAKHKQVRLLFMEQFYPSFLAEDNEFEKCILGCRFFVSVLDYTGFHYVGRMNKPRTPFEEIVRRYGKEKAEILLKYYCTILKMSRMSQEEEEKNRHSDILEQNMINTYGKDFRDEFMKFASASNINSLTQGAKFLAQVDYAIKYMPEYVDLSLVGM